MDNKKEKQQRATQSRKLLEGQDRLRNEGAWHIKKKKTTLCVQTRFSFFSNLKLELIKNHRKEYRVIEMIQRLQFTNPNLVFGNLIFNHIR